ncbi:MAG: ribosome biogenesis GTPase Der, partial [Chloroflexi bacterium]|nr:ribosome biogenesis GTPase Der [Chloroflexota bacterium]
QGIEAYSVLRAMRAIERADIAIVVIDAVAGVAAQDAHVAGYIHESAKGCILAVNKWDLVQQEPRAGDRYRTTMRRELAFLDYAPILFVSAATKLHVTRLLDRVLAIADERDRRVPTSELNEFIRSVAAAHPLTQRGKTLKVLYATQASVRPPTFVLFVNEPSIVHFSYRR